MLILFKLQVILTDTSFIVEAIKEHAIGKNGALMFKVEWEGYGEADSTWEPEQNLRISGDTILKEYYKKIGGRNKIFGIKERQDSHNATGRRRSRRGTKHLAEAVPRIPEKKWCPPEGPWEDEIESIDGLEEGKEDFIVFLRWKNGKKTKHGIHVIHKKCPQMMLRYYKRHIQLVEVDQETPANS
ncbi:hypothetical protein EDB81DRAFT_670227 [Dactylonectria macrodidyma]|uniref:Chromo domain-containing protein n=1 Tax=Dactylonectria macrodidyma TaxID=307937 RepID=A0A9P9D6M6_9HYPO|nr:hypothetical protein EDB81DRAFT_670227 [Dactylonectria macrodidyma]